MKSSVIIYILIALIVLGGSFAVYCWVKSKSCCKEHYEESTGCSPYDYKEARDIHRGGSRYSANYCNPFAYKQPITFANPNAPNNVSMKPTAYAGCHLQPFEMNVMPPNNHCQCYDCVENTQPLDTSCRKYGI